MKLLITILLIDEGNPIIETLKIFNEEDNKPESRYGSTRSTLFGKFYERIISKYLEEINGYHLIRWENNQVNKPRIYWKKINMNSYKDFNDWLPKDKIIENLDNKNSHCTPDGAFIKGNSNYIWEAKHWAPYPEKGSISQLQEYFIANPWIFADTFQIRNQLRRIDGFLFSFWNMTKNEQKEIEQNINNIIGEEKFRIILTYDILDDCRKNKYGWYTEIIEQEKWNIDLFFSELLGNE